MDSVTYTMVGFLVLAALFMVGVLVGRISAHMNYRTIREGYYKIRDVKTAIIRGEDGKQYSIGSYDGGQTWRHVSRDPQEGFIFGEPLTLQEYREAFGAVGVISAPSEEDAFRDLAPIDPGLEAAPSISVRPRSRGRSVPPAIEPPSGSA